MAARKEEEEILQTITHSGIQIRVATSERLFKPSSVLSQIDFKLRKLLLKV